MRLLFKTVANYSKCIKNVNGLCNGYFSRTVASENVVLNEETLTGRILIYLNHGKEKITQEVTNSRELLNDLKCINKNKLHKLQINDIINSLNALSGQQNFNKLDCHKILNNLDIECCLRLNELSIKDTFKLLNIYMNIVSYHIIDYKFYQMSTEKLFHFHEELSKNDFLQFMFYVSLQKKTVKAQIILKKCLQIMDENFINNLTTEELCIVCNSTFRASTKIANKQLLEKVKNYLNDNLFLLKDPALFITLIKTIRHNRCQDDNLLSTISCAIFFNKTLEYYPFITLCHILALYSDYKYYDGVLLQIFTNKCLQLLKQSKYTSRNASIFEQPRPKDIKRLLWSLSNLNYNSIEKNDLREIVVPEIICRIKAGEYSNDPDSLVEIILYLWMLNYQAFEIVPYALTATNVQTIRSQKSPTKDRLNLLLQTIYFENKELYNQLNLKPLGKPDIDLNYQLQQRPNLLRILDNLKILTQQLEINKFELTCEVPYLNIVGITGYRKKIYKAVYIEVLDDYTCVKNKESFPSGLMALKLRILERSEDALIVISQEEIDSLSESELQDYLHDELEFVSSLS